MNIDITPVSTTIAAGESTAMETHSTASSTTPVLSFPHIGRRSSHNSNIIPLTDKSLSSSSAVIMSTAALLALTKAALQSASLSNNNAPIVTATPFMHTEPMPAQNLTHKDDKASSISTTTTVAPSLTVSTDRNLKEEEEEDRRTDLQRVLHQQKQQEDEAIQHEQLQQQSRERAIELVLRQAKIHKVSRRLRSRLEFAILKIRRGWSKYTLQEIESLFRSSPTTRVLNFSSASSASAFSTSPSPPLFPSSPSDKRQPQQSSKTKKTKKESNARPSSSPPSSSPARQSGRKRVRRVYPDYEQPEGLYSSQEPEEKEQEAEEDDQGQRTRNESVRRRSRRLSQSTTMAAVAASAVKDEDDPTFGSIQRRKRGRPSYSQYKDSDLFSPAQSLMDIATSSSPAASPVISHSQRFHDLHQEPYLVRHPYSPYGYASSGGGPVYKSEHPSSVYSASVPNSPRMQARDQFVDEDGNNDGTDAQAAQTILMLASSPTRSSPRVLNPAYLNPQPHQQPHHGDQHQHRPQNSRSQRGLTASPVMHHAELPYSPMTSSPLVQYPASSPMEVEKEENPFMPKTTRAYNKKGSTAKTAGAGAGTGGKKGPTSPTKSTTSRPKKETLASLYGKKTKKEPQQVPEEMTIPLPPSSSSSTASVSSSRAVTPPPRSSSASSSTSTAHGIQTPPSSRGKELGAPHHLPSSSARMYSRSGSPSANKSVGDSGMVSSIKTRRMSSGLAGGTDNGGNITTDLRKVFPIPPPESSQTTTKR